MRVALAHRMPRLLLLAIIATGVVAMHTLGHRAMGAPPAAPAAHTAMAGYAQSEPAQPCHGMCATPDAACLFTLVTAGLLLVIALAGSAVYADGIRQGSAGVRSWPMPCRAPPPPWRLGLRLADLSILRT